MFHYCLGPLLAAILLAPTPARRHCQVPCGIYGDMMRIAMMREDAATIEKGMNEIVKLGKEGPTNFNQIVRWISNKDQHAQTIQNTVASYWLAQRIKAPKTDDRDSWDKYRNQLEILHAITVQAMKCKQTTNLEHVKNLRERITSLTKAYFSEKDLKHLKEHHNPASRPHKH